MIALNLLVLFSFLAISSVCGNWITGQAQTWLNPPVPYSQSAYYNGYRQDCSGYVSMAWGLGTSAVTWTLPQYAHQISKGELSEGDVMLNVNEHVLIFAGWANSQQTQYWAYEQTPPQTVYHVVNYPYWAGYDPEAYVPYRLNGMMANGTLPIANTTTPSLRGSK